MPEESEGILDGEGVADVTSNSSTPLMLCEVDLVFVVVKSIEEDDERTGRPAGRSTSLMFCASGANERLPGVG